jgi:hypothetical protein
MAQIPSLSVNRLQQGGGQSTAPGFGTHNKAAMEFNALPPLERTELPPRRMTRVFMPPSEGATKSFWVGGESGASWRQTPAKLKKNGSKCRIWVADENFSAAPGNNKITQVDVDNLATNFDAIYDKETAFFGYEYGGGPSGNGGIDGDPLIQILVYDIDGDYSSSQTGGTLGFFWGKDEYTQTDLDRVDRSLKSNKAEIFYVDAHFTKTASTLMYSTLAHEFQHMIQYNTKTLRLNKPVEAWYNEMLSMLAEDMLDRHIGITPPANITTDSGHPIRARIPTFKQYYWAGGATDWFDDGNVLISYANAYGLGAYLVRNYGGAKLLYEMARNNYVNLDSINAALAAAAGTNFTAALEKFPEVLVNNTGAAGTSSFNRAVTTWASPSGLTASDYTFEAFDIVADLYGPATPQPLRPYGIAIEAYGRNEGATAIQNYPVTITSYPSSSVKMYLLGKKSNGTVVKKDVIYQ